MSRGPAGRAPPPGTGRFCRGGPGRAAAVWASAPPAPLSTLPLAVSLGSPVGSRPNDRCPIGDRHPASGFDAGEVHAVQALVPLGTEAERRADAEIDVAHGLERLAQARARRVVSGAAQPLGNHLRVDEPLEADEAVPLRRIG